MPARLHHLWFGCPTVRGAYDLPRICYTSFLTPRYHTTFRTVRSPTACGYSPRSAVAVTPSHRLLHTQFTTTTYLLRSRSWPPAFCTSAFHAYRTATTTRICDSSTFVDPTLIRLVDVTHVVRYGGDPTIVGRLVVRYRSTIVYDLLFPAIRFCRCHSLIWVPANTLRCCVRLRVTWTDLILLVALLLLLLRLLLRLLRSTFGGFCLVTCWITTFPFDFVPHVCCSVDA